MKKKLAAIAVFGMVMTAAAAQAGDDGMYVSAFLGPAWLSDADISDATGSIGAEFDAGLAMGLAVGKSFDSARAELEFAYRKNDLDRFTAAGFGVAASGEITSKSLMANLYYDFSPKEQWSPFVGAGLGLARIEVDDISVVGINIGNGDDTVFAWQLMAGVGCKVADNTRLDLSYRYLATADPDFSGISAEFKSHNLLLGLRFGF